jgi:hypothetical protein
VQEKRTKPTSLSDFCSLILAFQYFSFSAFSPFVRGEEGETKEVTLATAFSEKLRLRQKHVRPPHYAPLVTGK